MTEETNVLWNGVPIDDLQPHLKIKFIENRLTHHSESAKLKAELRKVKPGDGKAVGPSTTQQEAQRLANRARGPAADMHWPEGYATGTVQDGDKFYAVIMRGQEVKDNPKAHTSFSLPA